MATDSGKCSILVLLDLSVAFDTVCHSTMLLRLKEWVGVTGSALDWFKSYLTGRCFSVAAGPHVSESVPLSCGVPQGSVLGPILFALYLLPLGHIIKTFKGISYHVYADDIQLYCSFNPDCQDDFNLNFTVLNECLSAIKAWLANNFLQLNEAKTEVLIVASDPVVSRVLALSGPSVPM